jgi:membrane-bound serine protease (ClpP class)
MATGPWIGTALAALALAPGAAVQEEPSTDPPGGLAAEAVAVVHVRIEGPLDIGTQSLLQRAIRLAEQDGTDLLVELDTPGGEVELMWALATQIDEASDAGVLTVAWVHDRALSAGALVAMACDRIYVRTQATIGAAAPVTVGPAGAVGEIGDDTMKAKVTSAVRSSFRAWAESHGRPPALAEAMVDTEVGVKEVVDADGVRRLITQGEYDDARMAGELFDNVRTIVDRGRLASVTGSQAVRLGLADGLAESLEEVLEKMGAFGATTVRLERERSEDLAALLHSLRFLLLLGGVAGAYLELKLPGFGLPGIASLICFALFLFGQYMVGLADVPQVVAVAAGLVLIAVEVFVAPGTLWFGIAGAALTVGGLVLAMGGASWDLDYAMDRKIAFDAVFSLATWTTGAVALGWALSRAIPHTPGVSRLILQPAGGPSTGEGVAEAASLDEKRGLVGARGRALTDLRPVGRVALDARPDEDFEALTHGAALESGARVRVVELSSGRLVVEAEDVA